MTYRAPIEDILFTMEHAAGMSTGIETGVYGDLGDGFARTIVEQAARFAEDILAPINRDGDKTPAVLANGAVTTPPGWTQAYAQWIEGGWAGLTAPAEYNGVPLAGMGLPALLHTACLDMWSAANMAFMLCPILSTGAIEALLRHGAPDLVKTYLPKIVSGEWTATMNLTEPGAGSDLGALRTRAERAGDGSYRIFGQKIFITYGEHDMTDNIVHLVLARLSDAPAGTRGISMFLVPKFFVNADGSPGARNDVHAAGLEHKMGIHGSPTCTMIFGDKGGATGWLIGEENRGLNCMFTMMNNARLATGLQGVSVGDRAFQQALNYARERRQGRPPGWQGAGMAPVAAHADVQRMLMTMKALTSAARVICYLTAACIDRSHRAANELERQAAGVRASLLTPIAKAYSTDIGNDVASIGVQIHGGMGFIEETGAAQHMRDIRIAAIYEGTNGIQAIDLATRKLTIEDGAAMAREIADMRATLAQVQASNAPEFGKMANSLAAALDSLERASAWMLKTLAQSPNDALAGAASYLRLFAI
ncbi:MAG: acyl-CoA dehydrogenase, partial [Alphaproteobacteria bacterium]|nr:acyl-CoA dehydrogenase [Alphaproteobacteria bacterium]